MRRLALPLLAAVFILSGCGLVEQGIEVAPDKALSQAFQGVNQPGHKRTMKDIVPGSWDTVHIFGTHDDREEIEKTVGVQVDMADTITSQRHLLFFMKDGKLVRSAETKPSNLVPGTYSSELVLKGRPIPGSTRLELVDPNKP